MRPWEGGRGCPPLCPSTDGPESHPQGPSPCQGDGPPGLRPGHGASLPQAGLGGQHPEPSPVSPQTRAWGLQGEGDARGYKRWLRSSGLEERGVLEFFCFSLKDGFKVNTHVHTHTQMYTSARMHMNTCVDTCTRMLQDTQEKCLEGFKRQQKAKSGR